MTLVDLECQNRGFYGFFGDFGLRDTFKERIVPKPIEIDMEKLPMKFSALNIEFDGSSLDFLGSRKAAHEGIKEVLIFAIFGCSAHSKCEMRQNGWR